MKPIVLLDKTYDGESMVDVFRDVSEAFDENFTPQMKDVPVGEYNIAKGYFRVQVIWFEGDGT